MGIYNFTECTSTLASFPKYLASRHYAQSHEEQLYCTWFYTAKQWAIHKSKLLWQLGSCIVPESPGKMKVLTLMCLLGLSLGMLGRKSAAEENLATKMSDFLNSMDNMQLNLGMCVHSYNLIWLPLLFFDKARFLVGTIYGNFKKGWKTVIWHCLK